jgi:hypothetical protein
MASPNNIPPPPPGFTAGGQAPPTPPPSGFTAGQNIPPPPPGFTAGGQPPTTTTPSAAASWLSKPADTLEEAKGLIKGAGHTAAGLLEMFADAPAGVPGGGQTPEVAAGLHRVADAIRSRTVIHGAHQQEGNIAESVAELLAAPEVDAEGLATKIPALSEHLAQGSKIAKFLESNAPVARAVRVGLDAMKGATRAGAEQGAQTYIKTGGEDPEAAAEAAKTGATFGGAIGAGASALGETANAIEAARTTSRNLAGANFPVNPKTGDLYLKPAAQGDPATQAVEQATGNIGKTAVAKSLLRSNAERAPETPPVTAPSRMLPAPADSTPGFKTPMPGETTPTGEGQLLFPARKKQIGNRTVAGKGSATAPTAAPYNASSFQYGDAEPLPEVSDLGNQPSGSHREPILQYLTSPKPGSEANVVTDTPMGGAGVHILTSDGQASSVGKARAQLAQYESILNDPETVNEMGVRQHQQLLNAHADLSDQLSRYDNYAASQPHFPEHDVMGAVQNTETLGQAGQVLKAAHGPFWQKADDASGGAFSNLREQEKFLEKKIYGPNPTGNLSDLQQQLADNQKAQMDFFDTHRAQFSPQEWQTARDGYQDGLVLTNLDNLIQSHFNGVTRAEETASAARGGKLNRIFDPSQGFNQQLENFYNKGTNRDVLKRTIGPDHMLDLKEMGQLFETAERQKATKSLLEQVGAAYRRHRYMGGSVGAGIGGTVGYGIGHGIGAAAGGAVGAGVAPIISGTTTGVLHYIGDKLASDPQFLKSFTYAVRNGVSPRFAAPLLATRIMSETSNQPSMQQREEANKEAANRGAKQ